MSRTFDCIVCGTCVVDLICRPISLDRPIGAGVLIEVDPLQVTGGGITSNAGIPMARMGLNVGVFSYVGQDAWAPVLRDLYRREGIDASHLLDHPHEGTSTTIAAVDPSGERSLIHYAGAPQRLHAQLLLDSMEQWQDSRALLLGYYSLLPDLESDLPNVLSKIRAAGCLTALDAAGEGGLMHPLDGILPHLDVYVPSLAEARNQTQEDDPRKIIEVYRRVGAAGLVGVKLGSEGVLLSPGSDSASPKDMVEIKPCTPPGEVVDTTGAGDNFYAGLLTGLLKGLSPEAAGRLGAATAACSVTSLGGCTGGRDYAFTERLAGLA